MVITHGDEATINQLKNIPSASIHMKELGLLTSFLGIGNQVRVYRYFRSSVNIYADPIRLANLTDDKIARAPILVNTNIKDDGAPLSNPSLFECLVGIYSK